MLGDNMVRFVIFLFFLIYIVYCNGQNEKETRVPDGLSDIEADNFRMLHHSLSMTTFNPSKIKLSFKALFDKSLLNIPFLNEIPIMHQLLNLYFQAARASPQKYLQMRREVVEVMQLAIEYDIDVDVPYKKDPSILQKSLILREIDLSTDIAFASKLIQSVVDSTVDVLPEVLSTLVHDLSNTFNDVYEIPCEVVPLSKLLLHADTIVRDHRKKEGNVDQQWIVDLLYKANPGVDSKPTTKITDLLKYSKTFNRTIIGQLGYSNQLEGIKLKTLISSLDETIDQLNRNLLNKFIDFQGPRKGLNSPDVIQRANDKAKLFGAILCYQDPTYKRNILHRIAISGATKSLTYMIDILERLLKRDNEGSVKFLSLQRQSYVTNDLSESNKPTSVSYIIRGALQVALLESQDHRSFLPYHYTAMRHGLNGTVFQLMDRLYRLIDHSIDKKRLVETLKALKIDITTRKPDSCEETGVCPIKRENMPKEQQERDVGGWDDHRIQLHVSSDERAASKIHINDDSIVNDVDRCDIEERWEGYLPTPQEFFETYVKTSTPVIFRGVHDVNTPLRMAFEKKHFLKRYGKERAPASKIPYASSFGIGSDELRMETIANLTVHEISAFDPVAPKYFFTIPSKSWSSKIMEDVSLPYCLERLEVKGRTISHDKGTVETQFYLGPASSGSPIHYHGHAVNSLAYGEKKWYLYHPSDAFYSTAPALEFVLHNPVAEKAIMCTQRAGDVIYVPALWSHGILNTKQSIGVAHEFSVEPYCSE